MRRQALGVLAVDLQVGDPGQQLRVAGGDPLQEARAEQAAGLPGGAVLQIGEQGEHVAAEVTAVQLDGQCSGGRRSAGRLSPRW